MDRIDFLVVSERDWDRTMSLNLKGAYFCLQQAGLRMKQNSGGRIINISDIAGLQPWKNFPVHSISKAGVNMLTQVAALALAPQVRVNGIAPGPVLKPEAMTDERWQKIGEATLLGNVGNIGDVVDAVHFLLLNDFVTGVTLPVDGGAALV
jgi:NAD(P)-dependent dehydrogenase (short-subunit alcohol dehydrogenase family)